MESNWRFNVWLYGESLGRFDMIARLLDGAGNHWLLAREPHPTFALLWTTLAPVPSYYPLWLLVRRVPRFGFPYGFDVEPD